ncbi:hypothetical protein [Helicobacter sp. T3_23-1056]
MSGFLMKHYVGKVKNSGFWWESENECGKCQKCGENIFCIVRKFVSGFL